MKAPKHYNNDKGSLYKIGNDRGWNAWEQDIIKRIDRCRKKGLFLEDLEKTKFLIDLYIEEQTKEAPTRQTSILDEIEERKLNTNTGE